MFVYDVYFSFDDFIRDMTTDELVPHLTECIGYDEPVYLGADDVDIPDVDE